MTRAFTDEPVAEALVDELLDLARRAPSAGNAQATGFVVLHGPSQVARYWDVTLPDDGRRARFRWQRLLTAPVLVLVTVDPHAYVARYAEHDKARSKTTGPGLGEAAEAWPVPYWWVDAGAVAQNLLLLCIDAGLGACLFGAFDHEPALRATFDLPDDRRLVATIALGHPAPDEDRDGPGRSARRPRPPLDHIVIRPA